MHPILRKALHNDALPEPLVSQLLQQQRRAVRVSLVARERGEIEAIRQLWARDRAAARPRLVALVDRLIAELRHEVDRRARSHGVLSRLAAGVDRRLPVDTVELMDRDDVDERTKLRIITDLDRVQEAIGTYERLLDVALPYLSSARSRGGEPLRVLDVASGHGGLPVWLAQHARDTGANLAVTASDLNPAFVRHTLAAADRAGVKLEARVLDALDMDLEPGAFDLITCTAAIHHLSHGQVAVLFAEAARVARRGVVFLDGYRSPTQLSVALGLFSVFGAARETLHDCAVSVRKMFVPEELALLAACTPGAEHASAAWVPPGWCALHGPGRG